MEFGFGQPGRVLSGGREQLRRGKPRIVRQYPKILALKCEECVKRWELFALKSFASVHSASDIHESHAPVLFFVL